MLKSSPIRYFPCCNVLVLCEEQLTGCPMTLSIHSAQIAQSLAHLATALADSGLCLDLLSFMML